MSDINANSVPTPEHRIEKIDSKTDALMTLLEPPLAGGSKIDLALQALGELLQGQQRLQDQLEAIRAKVDADHQ